MTTQQHAHPKGGGGRKGGTSDVGGNDVPFSSGENGEHQMCMLRCGKMQQITS